METVATRIPDDDAEGLAELEADMSADRSKVLRRLIRQGLDEWPKKRALDWLRDHSITLQTAAQLAEASPVEMLTLAAEEGIGVGYTTDDFERI